TQESVVGAGPRPAPAGGPPFVVPANRGIRGGGSPAPPCRFTTQPSVKARGRARRPAPTPNYLSLISHDLLSCYAWGAACCALLVVRQSTGALPQPGRGMSCPYLSLPLLVVTVHILSSRVTLSHLCYIVSI